MRDNPYYNPEDLGLTPVATVEDERNWDFNILAIWSDGKRFYWAEDSGYSCPTPFEDYTTLDTLQEGDRYACLKAINEFTNYEYFHSTRQVNNQAIRAKELVREWVLG